MLDAGTARSTSLIAIVMVASPLAAQAPESSDASGPAYRSDGAVPSGAVAQAVPSPETVLGYGIGERFTDHDGVMRYMEVLAEASPRVELRPYGTTVEGRGMVQVVIAREDHLGRLDEVLAQNRELSEPETPESRAREIAASNPAVVYFSYGVHGNESSSSEAAMWTAWDLARGAEEAADVLDSAVVVIDPVVNPDGRDRYVDWYKQARATPANPNPVSREHDEPWPGGRYNHYLFDLNRDWTWMSQPETRARIATWGTWTPQVHVDFHEMSWRSSYFFFPATEPINPLYPEHVLRWGERFGQANAAAFDEHGWLYYTAEGFDLFYPGYGDSWPSLLGAVGMTYEQGGGGGAGLAVERPDGSVLTLTDRAEHHRTAGLATAREAATGKTQLLLDFASFHRTIDQGRPDVLLVPGEDPTRTEALVALLGAQGIQVERATSAFDADATEHAGFAERDRFPAGTYRVPARQSRGLLASTLLQSEIELDANFSYDITAWSLPYAYGVEAHAVDDSPGSADWAPVPMEAGTPGPTVTAASAADGERAMSFAGSASDRRTRSSDGATAAADASPYGYLIEPGFSVWPALVRYLRAGGAATVIDGAFESEGREWPAGTIFLPRARTEGLSARVADAGLDAFVTPVETGWTDSGRDLGTDDAYRIELPRVAVLAGDGVSSTSYGAHWYFLERTLGLPFDALAPDRLDRATLEPYDVLVVPEARGSGAIGDAMAQVREWVDEGGTVVAVGGGARAVAGPLADVAIRRDAPGVDDDDGGGNDGESALDRALRGREAREEASWEERVPGTILPLRLDPAHPLAFGVGIGPDRDRMFALHRGGRIFEPDPAFETVAHFPDELTATSGVISPDNLDRVARGGWLVVRRRGGGHVILFADDPLFRHFWHSAFLPYVNALIVGPAM